MENHHDENRGRTRKSFQWIQEEDRRTLRNDEEKASNGVDEHNKVRSERERMLKECTEAATEELSKKKIIELDEAKGKSGMIETQRNKKKSEGQVEVEKIKQKKNKNDEDLKKRRILKHTEKRSKQGGQN